MRERYDPEIFSQKVHSFIRLGREQGVNNFGIAGTIQSKQGYLEVLFGYFPRIHGLECMVVAVGQLGFDPDDYTKRVLELSVPEETLALKVPDNPKVRNHMEIFLRRETMPSHVLVIGRSNDQEVIALYTIAGVSPETALKEIQKGMYKSISTGETYRDSL